MQQPPDTTQDNIFGNATGSALETSGGATFAAQTETHANGALNVGGPLREAVGVFTNAENLQDAMEELQRNGFMLQELSVLADKGTVREKIGHVYTSVAEAEADHRAPRTVFVPDEVRGSAEGTAFGVPVYVGAVIGTCVAAAAVGTLPVVIAAAALGGLGGAGVGTVFSRYISQHHADYVQEALEQGGILLWINLRSEAHAAKAQEILSRHNAHNIHVTDANNPLPTA
ncbi:MAG: hypothetical protein PW788_12365 [Micavibrio sp.]|nr:hypothetical protein [Micavibrio sp.]